MGTRERKGVVDGEGKGAARKNVPLVADRALIDEVGYVVAETRAMGLKKRAADKPGGTRVAVAVLIARRQVEPHADLGCGSTCTPQSPRGVSTLDTLLHKTT